MQLNEEFFQCFKMLSLVLIRIFIQLVHSLNRFYKHIKYLNVFKDIFIRRLKKTKYLSSIDFYRLEGSVYGMRPSLMTLWVICGLKNKTENSTENKMSENSLDFC